MGKFARCIQENKTKSRYALQRILGYKDVVTELRISDKKIVRRWKDFRGSKRNEDSP